MFENYLIYPDALAFIVNTMEAFAGNPVTPERIDNWLSDKAILTEYGGPGEGAIDFTNIESQRRLDGAKLLKDLVIELSSSKHAYDKIAHGIDLTGWILTNHPERFD